MTLGIAAGDYTVGQKLPSTREIARRCGLHANTVSSAYQDLVEQKLVEFRKGSGFYVAEAAGEHIEGVRRLDALIETLLEAARELGFDSRHVIERIKESGRSRSSSNIIVVEPDSGLREILVYELSREFPNTRSLGVEALSPRSIPADAILTAMFDEKPKIDGALTDGQNCLYLKGRSVSTAMAGESRPSADDLIAVVSGWDGFLNFARIMLLAAKIDPGNLIVRSTSDGDWKQSINSASMIICDSLTADTLSGRQGLRPFRVIADESMAELATILSPLS